MQAKRRGGEEIEEWLRIGANTEAKDWKTGFLTFRTPDPSWQSGEAYRLHLRINVFKSIKDIGLQRNTIILKYSYQNLKKNKF